MDQTYILSERLEIFCLKHQSCNELSLCALTRENLSSGFVTNKGAVQPVHLRRLISAFDIRFLESIISKLASREISIF